MRDLLLRFPAPISYRLIVIRVLMVKRKAALDPYKSSPPSLPMDLMVLASCSQHAALKDRVPSLFPYLASATCTTPFGKTDDSSFPP